MKPTPPHWPLRFLRWFCREDYLEEIEGDLVELFEKQYDRSRFKARWKFTIGVTRYLRPGFIRSLQGGNSQNYLAILFHNLLLTLRHYNRYKSTFVINLTGLSTGLVCATFIFLWVNDELAFDKFHENESRLFQVLVHEHYTGGTETYDATPGPLAKALAEDFPEVEFATTVTRVATGLALTTDDVEIEASGQFVDKNFFQMFSFKLIEGNERQVLTHKNSIVLSEKTAFNLFGTSKSVIGKRIAYDERSLLVTGVFRNVPFQSSAQFDFVLPFEMYIEFDPGIMDWNTTWPFTYVMLREGTDVDMFNLKASDFIQKRVENANNTLFFRPYADAYLYGKYENGVQVGGRIEYARLFSVIAIFILVVACINFINLSTAQASRRMKEVGIKKAMGVSQEKLVFQHFSESMLTTFLSSIVALGIILLLLPVFNEFTGKELSPGIHTHIMLPLCTVCLVTGLIAGSYPAWYLPRMNTLAALKGTLDRPKSEVTARRGLVVLQFMISVILIFSVLVVHRQVEFVQTKNLGYDKDQLIYFSREGRADQNLGSLLADLENIPGVIKATSISHSMIGRNTWTENIQWEGKAPGAMIGFELVHSNYDVIETLGIEMVAGRSFSRELPPGQIHVLLNQAAINKMGLEDPVGKSIQISGYEAQIVGITKDFHFESMHEEVKPLLFLLNPSETDRIFLKIEKGKEKETVTRLEQYYPEINPGFALDFTFLDSDYQYQYIGEKRVGVLSRYAAGLAILISCMGLFGLTTFTAERRTREMGIRKVLGASVWDIVWLLSGEFTRMVLVAIIIALPISYYIASRWLEDFAYRTEPGWWFFAGTAAITLLVAWLTVGLQTIKTAKVNPVECLGDE